MRGLLSRLRGLAARLREERSGVGAVEFAMIAPVLMVLFLGATDLSLAITVGRRVQIMTGAVNDLASQSDKLSQADLQAVFRLAALVIMPESTAPLTLKITSVSVDANGRATVDWTCGSKGASLPKAGDAVTLPTELAALRSRTVLFSEAHYAYVSPLAAVFTGPVDLSGKSFVIPRYSPTIDSAGCSDLSF